MIKISVIITIYNMERYLVRAVESILSQTFREFELILINDGSTDASARLCDLLARKDKRVKVVHQKNKGLCAARNMGIGMAKAPYIYFMDSDDYAEPSMLEHMHQHMETQNCDLLVAGYCFEIKSRQEDGTMQTEIFPATCGEYLFHSKEEWKEKMVDVWDASLMYKLWNKLFKTDLIKENQIQFTQSLSGEEIHFIIDYLNNCSVICVIKETYYHHIKEQEEALMIKNIPNLFEPTEQIYQSIKLYFNIPSDGGEREKEYLAKYFIEKIWECIKNIVYHTGKQTLREKMAYIKRIVTHPSAQEALQWMGPSSKKAKMMLLPLKWKNAVLTYAMGKMICYSSDHSTKKKFK